MNNVIRISCRSLLGLLPGCMAFAMGSPAFAASAPCQSSAGSAGITVEGRMIAADVIDRIIADELARTAAPGAAIAIISDENTVYTRGYGVANVETGAPVTPDMLFRIGSTTKMVTAAAALELVAQGKLSLHQPAATALPWLTPGLRAVTLHQLLSHSAGLTDEAPMYGPRDDTALESSIRAWTDAYSFAPPGEVFSYSNPGYRLAGLLIEKAHGRPFADAIKDLVLDPIGMVSSTFRPTVAMTYPLALGHQLDRERQARISRPFADHAGTWPTGSLFSNVCDLARLTRAFFDDGTIEDAQRLAPSTVDEMRKVHAGSTIAGAPYSYGLEVREQQGTQVLSHGGARVGYGSTILIAPQRRLAVIALSNGDSVQLERGAREIMNLLLDSPATLRGAEPVPISMTASEMSTYAGTYVAGSLAMTVRLGAGGLEIVQGTSALPMVKVADQTFALAIPGAPLIPFAILNDANGEPRYLYRGLRALRRQT